MFAMDVSQLRIPTQDTVLVLRTSMALVQHRSRTDICSSVAGTPTWLCVP